MTPTELPEKLWEVMCVDVIPQLELKNGEKKSIAVVVDVFSNMSFLYAVKNLTASEFVEKLKKKVFEGGMAGIPGNGKKGLSTSLGGG